MIELVHVDTPEKIEKTREIFRQYARFLDFDLSFKVSPRNYPVSPGTTALLQGVCFWPRKGTKLAGVSLSGRSEMEFAR